MRNTVLVNIVLAAALLLYVILAARSVA
jgi:hypothetical protein